MSNSKTQSITVSVFKLNQKIVTGNALQYVYLELYILNTYGFLYEFSFFIAETFSIDALTLDVPYERCLRAIDHNVRK